MTPERKAKIMKFLLGLLAAMAAAAIGYFSTNWTDVISAVPFGAAVGLTTGLVVRML